MLIRNAKMDLLLQTTLPEVVTRPSSLTLTSMTVPFVKTPARLVHTPDKYRRKKIKVTYQERCREAIGGSF